MNLKLFVGAAVVGCAIMGSGAANASTILFNLGSKTGQLPTTETYMASGLDIIASGFATSTSRGKTTYTLQDLWGKNDAGDEIGLGLKNDTTGDHEIQYGKGFVQIDVSDLLLKVNKVESVTFETDSTTNGEEWGVYGTNTASTLVGATEVAHGTTETAQLLPDLGVYKYYDYVELSGSPSTNNFLIHEFTVQTIGTPEPATWAMMLMGFGGLGAALRMSRRRQAAAAA